VAQYVLGNRRSLPVVGTGNTVPRALLASLTGRAEFHETLWTALSAWASFQLWKATRRLIPGKLFYPTEASNVFEKHWDYLTCLPKHPDFASESSYCQEHMVKLSRALAKMKHKSFVPKSTREAKQSVIHIAENAALSRLRPITDGPGQLEVFRRSTDTDSGASGAILDSDNVPV
jgi:hypothetical protein